MISKAFNYVDKNGQLLLVGQPKINSILRLKDPLKLLIHLQTILKFLPLMVVYLNLKNI